MVQVLASDSFTLSSPAATLLGEWQLDETTGSIFVDSRPAAVSMTIVGTWNSLTTASMVAGLGGTSAYRGSGAAYATLPAGNAAHNLTTGMTLSLYYQANGATAKHILFSVGDGSQVGDLSIELLVTGQLRGWHVGQDGVLRFFESSAGVTGTNLAVGVAHRIDASFGPLGTKLYLDGTFLPAAWIQSNTNGWNNARVKYLGIYSDGVQSGADGVFDEVRLWGSQLSDSVIASLNAAQSISLPVAPPVAVSSSFGNITQGSGNQLVDVLAAPGTFYQNTPTITINSQVPSNLGATVDTSGSRPQLAIPKSTLQASCSVTWTLTHSSGAGSSQATASGAVVVASTVTRVGLWSFAETSGVTFADSVGTNTATLAIPSWTVQTHVLNRKGIVAGTDNAIEVSNGGPAIPMAAAYRQNAASLVIYVEPRSRMRGHQYWNISDERFGREVIAWCDDGSTPGSFVIYRRYSGSNPIRILSAGAWSLGGYVRNASGVKVYFGGSQAIAGASLPVDTAKRIVLTQGSAGAQLYLDDALVSSISAVTSGWTSLTNVITLGSSSNAGHANDRSPLWGRLDECAVYTGQLSLAQVQALPAAAQSVIWRFPSDFVGGATDINIANFSGNPQGAMDAAHAAGRYVYQNTNDATVYTGSTVGTDSLMFFKPNCKGMVGVKLRMYSSGSHYGRIVLMGTPEGAMAGHGDRYLSQGGYKFIGCDFDNNARSNNWFPTSGHGTTYSKFQLEQQACFKIDSSSAQGRFTTLFDSCDFRDSCGDALNGSSYVNINVQSCRFYGCFRGPVVPGYIGQMTVTSKTYESYSDNSFGQLWGCGFQDIEFDGAGNNMVCAFYDVWADGDFDEQNCGTGSSTVYVNSHTIGGGMDFVNNLFGGGSLNKWEQHYCTISYHHDYGGYPQSVLQALMTGLGPNGALYDNCVFLANGSPYNYHDSYITTPVNTDQFAILYRSSGTQGRLITMRSCQWRAKNLPASTPTGNVLGFLIPALGTGQSIEFDGVTIDAAFADLPFQMGGITVRWRNTLHERTGNSTIWSGAGSVVAF